MRAAHLALLNVPDGVDHSPIITEDGAIAIDVVARLLGDELQTLAAFQAFKLDDGYHADYSSDKPATFEHLTDTAAMRESLRLIVMDMLTPQIVC